jgi:hypothetical protein
MDNIQTPTKCAITNSSNLWLRLDSSGEREAGKRGRERRGLRRCWSETSKGMLSRGMSGEEKIDNASFSTICGWW